MLVAVPAKYFWGTICASTTYTPRTSLHQSTPKIPKFKDWEAFVESLALYVDIKKAPIQKTSKKVEIYKYLKRSGI